MFRSFLLIRFTFFIILLSFCQKLSAFDGGEHALIGNLAFAKTMYAGKNRITNLETKMVFDYGLIVAMSGDMYTSVEEIALSDPLILNGFFGRNRKGLKNCITREVESIRQHDTYSGCSDFIFAKKKLKYLTLAHDNYTHFAWHNIKMYVKYHTKALWFAKLAYLKCSDKQWQLNQDACNLKKIQLEQQVEDSDYREKLKSKYRKLPQLFPRRAFSQRYFLKISKQKMMDLALFTNGFADHFLSDAFSAGHLRVPRSQIDAFVAQYGINEILQADSRHQGSSLSGALTQLLHNTDGYLSGTPVRNGNGERFILRSDKQLFSLPGLSKLSSDFEHNQQLKFPVHAVQLSLNEVFAVLEHGEKAMPKGVYNALNVVPFIENPEKHSLHAQILSVIDDRGATKRIIDQMSEEMSILFKIELLIDDTSYRRYLADFVKSIPQLMTNLRLQISIESKDKTLQNRIPTPLLESLLNLH